MDVEAWAARPDVCRCCLSASGTWNLTSHHIDNLRNDSGIKEVFADALKTCYGITFSFLSDTNASQFICNGCVNSLRNAYNFRQQVIVAEENFVKFYNYRKSAQQNVKQESGLEYGDYEYLDLGRDQQGCDGAEQNVKQETGLEYGNYEYLDLGQDQQDCDGEDMNQIKKKILAYNCPQPMPSLNTTKTEQNHQTEDHYDSDAPIAGLFNEKRKLKNTGNKCKEIVDKSDCKTVRNKKFHIKEVARTKEVSKRKRVILTCAVVLKDTTACPFRHHKSWFQCFYCTLEFMDMTTLRNHITDNHQDVETELRKLKRYPRSLQIDISNLECRDCHLNLTDVDSMQRHFESAHGKMIYKEFIADYKVDCSPYSCHLCKEEFHVFRTLTIHLNEHYANCICDICGRSFMNSKRLSVHQNTHENGKYPCAECGKILKSKNSKANHMLTHSKRQMKCQICFKPMKHYNDRIKHMSEVHNITHVFKCKICLKEYNVKHYLATHMRQTHGNKNKECHDCGMVFITNHGLKKHMSKHTGAKPHKCVVCGKSYARSYTLRQHMRSHEDDSERLRSM